MSGPRGPLPQEDARRSKYIKPRIPTDLLDTDGYDGEIPEPIQALTDRERQYYEHAWRSPAACGWHVSDAELVARWARLTSLVQDYLGEKVTKIAKTGEVVPAELPAALLSKIETCEDRLYLSPRARKMNRVRIDAVGEIESAGVETSGNVVRPDRWQTA